jgi:hypothetical protein
MKGLIQWKKNKKINHPAPKELKDRNQSAGAYVHLNIFSTLKKKEELT